MRNNLTYLNILHILNDGFKASLLLFLPFISREFGMSLTDVGVLGTSVNLLDVLLALPAGYFAAKYGGVRVLTVALMAYAAGFLFTGIAPSFLFVIPAFLAAGIGFGVFHPMSFAVVAKTADKSTRGSQLGTFTALGDIGRIAISSVITFAITWFGWRKIALSCFAGLAGFFFMSLRLMKRSGSLQNPEATMSIDTRYVTILKNARFRLSAACFFLDTFASSSLFVFIPFLLLKRGVPPAMLGILTSTFFFGNMFGKAILGKLVDKAGNVTVFILSEISMAVFIVLLSNSTWLPLIIASSVVLGIFTKGTVPVLTAMVSDAVEHHNNFEKAFGLNALITGMAATLSPLLLGFLSDRFGIVAAFNVSALLALTATVPAFLYKWIK